MANSAVSLLRQRMDAIVRTTPKMLGLIISDRDGVPLTKALCDTAPNDASKPSFLAVYSPAADQASKINLGTNQFMVFFYDSYQLICINRLPAVITVIANAEANTNLMLDVVRRELDDIGLIPHLQRLISGVVAQEQPVV